MNGILLTQDSTFIIGQVAWVLGIIMEGIFTVIDMLGIPNIGLAIILFTIVVNILMMPLTIKQQKFSKLSAKMSPEVQAIQAKYKDKKDNDSVMAQNQEVQAVYAKYGVSPTGSCLPLLIHMPILFALYKVIYAMPAYVSKIGDTFRVLADKIITTDNGAFLQNSGVETINNTVAMYGKSMTEGSLSNGVIDVLNKLSSTDMALVADHYDLASLTYEGQLIFSNDTTVGLLDTYNNFLGLNIADSPFNLIASGFQAGAWGIVIGAIAIPLLSALTQWINVKLMPQQSSERKGDSQADSMAASMKTMNNIMPIMSAWFCFSLPSGMGLYWVAGSVVRSIQQVLVNKHLDKLDFDEIIKKNQAKSAKKLEKMQRNQEVLNAYANMNTRNIQSKANVSVNNTSTNTANTSFAKAGSMMEKANMVTSFNEKNNK